MDTETNDEEPTMTVFMGPLTETPIPSKSKSNTKIEESAIIDCLVTNDKLSDTVISELNSISGVYSIYLNDPVRKLVFSGSHEKMREVLHVLFPIYIGKTLVDSDIKRLRKPLVPLNVMFPTLKVLQKILKSNECTHSIHPWCGNENEIPPQTNENRHSRLLIAHLNPIRMADFIWSLFEFLEFKLN